MADSLQTYLSELWRLHASGAAVAETSYYPPLHSLLADIGRKLKPAVFCIQHPKDKGAGLPDFGLYTKAQLPKHKLRPGMPAANPERGAVEAKPASRDVDEIAASEQVERYRKLYGLVLVTNYWDFLLVGTDRDGTRREFERFRLAPDEAAFWDLAAHPVKAAQDVGARFHEFLSRVLLYKAPLTQPKELAWFLASYARDGLARVEAAGALPALSAVRESLEQALGFKFEGDKGDHFFRSTLVQTLFYGVFSAWVLWSRQQKPGSRNPFDWHAAAWSLHVPMVRTLFGAVATPDRLQPLGLVEVLDWTAAALNRVDRATFFANFDEGQAVQYFYEPFLEAFDPVLRKELGVWYTPPEIVRYMVERVDRVLRQELGRADGLADRQVVVLDPCCGTGSYLVEVLRRIARTLEERGEGATLGPEVRRAAQERVFGFEIMPAPYVIAHWQVGLFLAHLGAPLADESAERAGIYLTNSLTGWEPPSGPKKQLKLALPELAEERDAAERVKQEAPILVILGNPPYNAFAGVAPESEGGLVDAYKEGLQKIWGIKKFNLDDLYVRFFRIAERRIAERTGEGIICFISNFSFLGDPSYVVMRQRLLSEFDSIWIDCLNGDSRETGKLTPEGKPDPSIFSTEFNREGIRVGTSVSLMARKREHVAVDNVRFRHFWGANKRHEVLASLETKGFESQYLRANPAPQNRFSFRPLRASDAYMSWPQVVEFSAIPPSNGLLEKRAGALIDTSPELLKSRMRRYYDRNIEWADLIAEKHPLTRNAARYNAQKTRDKVLNEEKYSDRMVRRYLVRAFDVRWCYYSKVRPLWNEPRPSLWAQCWEGNEFFITRMRSSSDSEGVPAFFASTLSDDHMIVPDAVCFPVMLKDPSALADNGDRQAGLKFDDRVRANASVKLRSYMAKLGYVSLDVEKTEAALPWQHALAMCFCASYLRENTDSVLVDWPRIPLPAKRVNLETSAALGRQIAALLDIDSPVEGVTAGKIRPELAKVAVVQRVGGGQLTNKEMRVTVGWGHAGREGVTMPGKGRRIERPYSDQERAGISAGAELLGLSDKEAIAQLGTSTGDVYLNETAYWSNVPSGVWDYTVGGYQVMKKWLSYREYDLLGRALTLDELREITNMARRIAAILLLQPALDASYRTVVADAYPWPQEVV